ncbi:MAG: hypothetical protein ACON5B_10040 [Myxococcota bacterium]
MSWAHRRINAVARHRCADLLVPRDTEELLADVMLTLMKGALARFNGNSTAELHAFVRTICDRSVFALARRRIRERDTVDLLKQNAKAFERSHRTAAQPRVEFALESPLPLSDQRYLQDLLRAGSKANLAKHRGCSRAAVTQKVGRILARLDPMTEHERLAHDAWLRREAAKAALPSTHQHPDT